MNCTSIYNFDTTKTLHFLRFKFKVFESYIQYMGCATIPSYYLNEISKLSYYNKMKVTICHVYNKLK